MNAVVYYWKLIIANVATRAYSREKAATCMRKCKNFNKYNEIVELERFR